MLQFCSKQQNTGESTIVRNDSEVRRGNKKGKKKRKVIPKAIQIILIPEWFANNTLPRATRILF